MWSVCLCVCSYMPLYMTVRVCVCVGTGKLGLEMKLFDLEILKLTEQVNE